MAFFDDMSKRLTMAGQSAVQKTKDIAEITRLNSVISEEERKLESTYANLGKMYFSLHSEDCEAGFKAMVDSVKECEIKIAQYRQQIKDIKGVGTCENCGADVPNDAAFCSSCGTPVAKKIPDGMVQCPKCGQLAFKDAKFCTGCGNGMVSASAEEVIQDSAPAEEVTVSEESVVALEPVVEETAQLRCPNCNSEITEDIAFCTECGTRVR